MAANLVEVEIWDKAKHPVADISSLVENLSATLKLNGIHSLQFSMDLDKFEAFCASIKTPPRALLWPLQCDIIVKLDGEYWKGFEVVAVTPYLNQTGSTLSVRCNGFLSLFSKRYTSEVFNNVESTLIARNLITGTQAQTNGDLGVTIGPNQYTTGILRDRTDWKNKNIKDAIVSLAQGLEDGNFDIDITYDKKFNTYEQLGALRTDTPLRYGKGGNIKSVNVPTEGSSVANKVTGLGSGFGDDQITSVQGDAESQLAYSVREELPQFNSVSSQDELDENTAGYLALVKDMLQIPAITVTGDHLNPLTTDVGDRFPVDLTAHAYTDNVTGLYRVEELTVSWDKQSFPELTLKFDDHGVDQSEAA